MLELQQLARNGLSPVDLSVADGECVAISGRSGSGKSLFLRAIADLDPNQGRITLDGNERLTTSAPEWRRKVIYVAADSGWWTSTVGDHFELPDIASGYLMRLGFHGDVMSWPVSRLSSGERQRLALLRALVLSPRVLLLDEPTSALDPEATAMVESLIREKLSGGVAVVMVTHDKRQAERIAARHYVMEQGRLSEDGAVK